MDELVGEFLTETNESLEVIDVELVTLEKDPNNPEILGNIFRLVHTIKGTCGFLGLPRLESVAHSAENILGKIRDGDMEVTVDVISIVLEALDRLKEIMGELEQTGEEPAGDDSELIQRLDEMAKGGTVAAPAKAATEAPPADEQLPGEMPVDDDEVTGADTDLFDPELGRGLKEGEVPLDELERLFQETDGPLIDAPPPAEAAAAQTETAEATPEMAAPATPEAPAAKAGDKPKAAQGGGATQSIRVNVDLLESMMNLVSELVLTRNQLLQMVRHQAESELTVPLQGLSHVTTELQESVMKTRMQPIGNAWQKLPRIIRDLATELGKKIELEMIGAETELDRQVLELIRDPLTHMVRNSADHGLEMPDERVAAGKPETGHVVLNAHHEGGHIIIEIRDDGAGINVERVKEKALSNGVTTEAELAEMTDQQILRFIFAPGFSTAAEVTAVSGRGVGMDVVRTNIEQIGGTVDVKSVQGKGSTFTIKIPLTLAIVSALVVECGGERYALPQLSVLELVRASGESEYRIETINATPVLRLRDRLLPLVYLRDILRLDDMNVIGAAPSSEEAGTDALETGEDESGADYEPRLRNTDEAFVVVTQVGNYRFGIVVDRVFDSEEIVVKPVSPILTNIKEFSGNTILGDGSVIMILDPNGIAEATGEIAVPDSEEATAEEDGSAQWGTEVVELLLFKAGDTEPKAVPLSLVSRLEEFAIEDIENSNGRMVVQYRGRLMPLVTMDAGTTVRQEGRQPVLVFADGDNAMGLVVDQIVDIVEDHLDIELSSGREGLLGTAVVRGEATSIIDTAHYLTQAFRDWFRGRPEQSISGGRAAGRMRVLLVDDSPFFRNLLMPILSTAGFDVTPAEDANQAFEFYDAGENFDIIVSDIEMPGMNGFEFATRVRDESRWKDTPMVALSAHTSPQDVERGRACGFDEYLAKYDRDVLMERLSSIVSMRGNAA